MPGLVVDQVITHPFSTDFYQQSHHALRGTVRSAHYFALRNNMRLGVSQLQSVTHTFCYTYAKATKGVSYCAPAYYADRLCDRGRAYLRHWLQGRPQYGPSRPPHPGASPPKESPQEYSDAMKDEVQNSDYWRYYLHRPYPTQPPPGSGQPSLGPPQKDGAPRMNPWHENLDDTMFYL